MGRLHIFYGLGHFYGICSSPKKVKNSKTVGIIRGGEDIADLLKILLGKKNGG